MGARKIERWSAGNSATQAGAAKRPALVLVPQAGRWRQASHDRAHEEDARDDDEHRPVHQSGIVPVRRGARVLPFPQPAPVPRFSASMRALPSDSAVWQPSMPPRMVLACSALFLLLTIAVAALHYA